MQPTQQQIDELVANHPLGVIVSMTQEEALSTPLPFVLDRSESPAGVLHGHFSAANPQIALLHDNPIALVTFQGPSSYISPSWLRDRTQAPTWFYTFVEFLVDVKFFDDAAAGRENLERLVDHLEDGRTARWSLPELGPRYDLLFKGVRPFRAEILRTRAKFKLGQNDRPDVVRDAIEGLDGERKRELAEMVRLASRRLQAAEQAL